MRYRLLWAKRGKLRYLSHHDVATTLERSFRRASLPLSYTQGFSSHPKIAFGSGLPVGYGSEVELLDLELTEDVEPEELCCRLEDALPPGLHALAAGRLDRKGPSLGETIVAADYEVDCDAPWLSTAIARFMALDSFPFTRPYKGAARTDDLRSGVLAAGVCPGGFTLRCRIQPRSTRPADVIAALESLAGESRGSTPITVRRVGLLQGNGGDLAPVTGPEHPVGVSV
jgi:radical SAM-linked protein